jgi:hypothetical protein
VASNEASFRVPFYAGLVGVLSKVGQSPRREDTGTGLGLCCSGVDPLFKFIYVFTGVMLAVFFGKDSPSAMDRIQRMFPAWPIYICERVDFVLLMIFGTVLGYFLFVPQDQGRAVLAGSSAVALLKQVLVKVNRQGPKKAPRK